MAKSRRYGGLIITLIVLVIAGGATWYFWDKKTDKQPEFATTKVGRGDITQVVTATGDLQSLTQVDVSSQISGQVIEVKVDFNTPVKTGQVLARLDPATYIQKLKAAKADLASTEAANTLQRLNTERTRELHQKNLVSKAELDQAEAQLKQSDAQLATRQSTVDDASVNLERCTIYAPIDGIVLARLTDKGRTVSASTSAPTLFTIVNDLTKMQISAAVAEADIGSIEVGQDVTFTVDAFPNRSFRGKVYQVRNAAKANQSVVSYDTMIEVSNDDQKLKPGMTANVSIIIAQKTGVLRVANSALRVRIPQELMPKAPAAPAAAPGAKPAPVAMTDEEKFRATMEVMREAGYQRGQPATPEILEKAKALAKEKGLDPEAITQFATRMASRSQGGGGAGGGGGGGGGRRGGGGSGGGGGGDRGFSTTVASRTVYRMVDPSAKDKKLEAVTARLGISDGFYTEVIEGLNENDALVTNVTLPGAPSPVLQAPGGAGNPFQGGRPGGGLGGGGGGGGGGRR